MEDMTTARRTTVGLYLLIAACGLAPAEQAAAQIKSAQENPYLRFGETHIGRYQVVHTTRTSSRWVACRSRSSGSTSPIRHIRRTHLTRLGSP